MKKLFSNLIKLNTIGKKFMFFSVLIIIVILVSFKIYEISTAVVEGRNNLKAKSSTMAGLAAISMQDPVWSFNTQGVQASADALFNDKEIFFVIVLDDKGKVLFQKELSDPIYKNNTSIMVKDDIKKNETKIGSVEIGFTNYFNNSVAKRKIINSVVEVITMIITLLFVMSFISKAVTKPIKEMTFILRDISEGGGDLTQRIKLETKDEISKMAGYFNTFIEKMQQIIIEAKASALNVHSFSKNLTETLKSNSESMSTVSLTTKEMDGAALSVNDSIQQTSTTMEETAEGLSRIAIDAQNIVTTVNDIEDMIINGEKLSENAAEQIEVINNKSKVLSTTSNELKSAVLMVSDIINTIRSIADRTNLLALNAAIESARAGEVGRGFAVVAEEIRKLAEMSQESARSIGDLLKHITDKTMITFDSVNEVSDRIAQGREKVMTVYSQFANISVNMKNILGAVENTSASIEQQNASNQELTAVVDGISHITYNMQKNMSNISQEVNHQVREIGGITTDAEKLLLDSKALNTLLDKFKV